MLEWLKRYILSQPRAPTAATELNQRLRQAAERRRLERQRSDAKSEQYAETLDFPVQWDCGAPMPQLLVNDYEALLAFIISEPALDCDGSHSVSRDLAHSAPLALVQFERCLSAKLGAPNDEVFGGHPLSGKGLEPYAAQRVVNSAWLRELEAINAVHPRYAPAQWRDLNHYVFWFKDSTFECIAQSYQIEIYRESMKALLVRMVDRVTAWP